MIQILLLLLLTGGEVLDRLALSVGDEIITEQQLLLHLRTAALLNGEASKEGPADKRRAAQKLIELTLIRIEMQTNRYPLPGEARVKEALEAVKKQRFGGDDKSYREALAKSNVNEAELLDSLQWQLAILSFIDFRFRPGVQIPEEEIRDYFQYDYQKEFAGRTKELYNQARPEILELLTQQRIDNLLDRWLNQTEAATKVRWVEAVFSGGPR
jgi:peptidyl-prolyl cis-trans isomerase SurA